MIGRTLSHYRVVEEIDAGAMGVVYRAQDLHLAGRDVALKVLPPSLLGDSAAIQRFRKGAIALSRLHHRHIADIYDLDSDGDQVFLIMEYVPGETLSKTLRSTSLSDREVLRLGIQLAEGVEAAHKRGVLHRDLKPSNVRVTPDGEAKILDFGLARLLPDPGREAIGSDASTESHDLVGTLPYMAPEVLRNGKADVRADIYSLGVMLYEMACGRRPFQGSGTALIAEILDKPAPPPGRFNSQITPQLEAMLLKAIEKDSARRHQSAGDLLADLRRLETPSASQRMAIDRRRVRAIVVTSCVVGLSLATLVFALRQPGLGCSATRKVSGPSIAVLPLANLSGDPSQEYFADGMTEAIITDLARIGALRVIARASTMQYKGTKLLPPEVARQLGVGTILSGSVQRDNAGRVRVTAELIDAKTNTDLWANQFDGDIQDVLALQSRIAQTVARQIQVVMTPAETRRLAMVPPVNPESYDLYLRGRAAFYLYTPEGLREAVRLYEAAIARDSTFAPAWAGLALAEAQHVNIEVAPDTVRISRAIALAKKATRMQPDLAEGPFALGFAYGLHGEWADARKALLRAIELEPNHAPTHSYLGYVYENTGFLTSAQRESETARELDPFLAPPSWTLCLVWHDRGNHRKALDMLRQSPLRDNPIAAPVEARELFELRDANGLDSLVAKGVRLGWGPETLQFPRALMLLARKGIPFGQAVRESLKTVPPIPVRAVAGWASVAAVGGADEIALRLLETAVGEGYCNETLLRRGSEFRAIRDEPRFKSLSERAAAEHRALAQEWNLAD